MHTQVIQIQAPMPGLGGGPRPEVSVYWKPGCSMCLKVKEFLTDLGVEFEALNVVERGDALDELMASGVRGLPAVRRGDKLILAQSLDDVAEFVGAAAAAARHDRLTLEQLFARWGDVLDQVRGIIVGFSHDQLERQAIIGRKRSIKELSSHVFQIPEAFMTMIQGEPNIRSMMGEPRPHIVMQKDLYAYADRVMADYSMWQRRRAGQEIGDYIETFWGRQPAHPVVERFVWHSTQHARQLDVIAAGLGREFQIPPHLYVGLPLPKRLWG